MVSTLVMAGYQYFVYNTSKLSYILVKMYYLYDVYMLMGHNGLLLNNVSYHIKCHTSPRTHLKDKPKSM